MYRRTNQMLVFEHHAKGALNVSIIVTLLLVPMGLQALMAQTVPTAPLAAPSNKKVLIIGTDGTRPDKMEQANTPNIKALIATSAYSNKAKTGLPTVSGPSWSSMLTGVWRDKHGVADNSFKGKNYTQYPDFLTRLEKINPRFSTFAAADWPPILTADGGGPLISDAVDVKLALKGHDATNDGRIADLAATFLARENVDAAFVYFGEVDGQGHAVGPLHPKYTQAIERMDKYVGQLVGAIRSRPNYANEDWLILISTDHGHVDKGGHGGPSEIEQTIFFLANGKSVEPLNLQEPVGIVDIGVTALAHLGIKADPVWLLDGKVQALKTP